MTRVPPSAGECVAQALKAEGKLGFRYKAGPRAQGIDISQWQGYYPRLTGLSFVIIQSNYGLNVEPSVYEQVRDAREHHVAYGCYTFLEPGVSGTSEAQLAHRVCPGAPLGLTADAEVGGAYEHACAYTAEARALGERIYMLFSYPGGWPYGRPCVGWLYTSEWGTTSYPFGGYPRSAVLVHQYCGQCYRYGVETDLDEDLGLLSVAKPTPPPSPAQKHAREEHELRQAETTRRALHKDIEAHKCRPGEHNLPREPERLRLSYHSICGYWIRAGGRAIARETMLRREL